MCFPVLHTRGGRAGEKGGEAGQLQLTSVHFLLFISHSALLPLSISFSCLLTSVYLTVSLHLLLLSLGATLEFQLFSACVCVFLCVFECRCVCEPVAVPPCSRVLTVLQAAWGVRAVCVDPVETPGIPAIWQTAYSIGGVGVTRFNGIVCVCPEADRLIGHMEKPSQVVH